MFFWLDKSYLGIGGCEGSLAAFEVEQRRNGAHLLAPTLGRCVEQGRHVAIGRQQPLGGLPVHALHQRKGYGISEAGCGYHGGYDR